MITNFKLFELNNNNPEIGDYVICDAIDIYDANLNFEEFRVDNIGKILKIDSGIYSIYYEYNVINKKSNIIYNGTKDEIKYWSKNKKELEEL